MREINVGQELLNVPMGEMVKSMALGIAQGQWELDKSSMTVAELISGQRLLRDLDTGELVGGNKGEKLGKDGKPVVVDSRVYFGYNYEKKDGEIHRVPQKVSRNRAAIRFMVIFIFLVKVLMLVKGREIK